MVVKDTAYAPAFIIPVPVHKIRIAFGFEKGIE
jgi:hypothetical protein